MTIREVAKRAGVSLQTVSNVLNGRMSQMGEKTRERVLRSIEELGYHPNAHARGLRSQRTYTVGFLTVDPSTRFLADPFHTAILSGMADILREQDYCLLVQALHPEDPGESFQRLFQQRRLDGAVVHLSGRPEARRRWIHDMNESGSPFVLLEERGKGARCASVRADNHHGAACAVEHLQALGHRRLGFLYYADPSWPAIEERLAGFEETLQQHRLPKPTRLIVSEESFDHARGVLETALRRDDAPTAIVCSNDVLAVGALQAAKEVGRRVPGDLAIIGFDDFDFAAFVEPALTTIALPSYDMGRRAAELLLGHLKAGAFAEKDVVFPTTLIKRRSA